jgi:hypothetical protein
MRLFFAFPVSQSYQGFRFAQISFDLSSVASGILRLGSSVKDFAPFPTSKYEELSSYNPGLRARILVVHSWRHKHGSMGILGEIL